MRYYKIIAIVTLIMGLISFFAERLSASRPPKQSDKSFYEFKAESLSGEEIDFEKYRGRKVIVVNTASRCGYTPQYKDLQKIHEQYGSRVDVLGFPANNFLWQEPGSNESIAEFCEKNYGVDFQMFAKVSVKGKDQHPIFQWLEEQTGKAPGWNFCKYIINEQGKVVAFFPSKVKPSDPEILKLLE